MFLRVAVLVILITCVSLSSSRAQELVRPPDFRIVEISEGEISAPDFEHIHVTDVLMRMPEAREGLRKYHEAREAGILPLAKAEQEYTVGDERSFNVMTNLGQSQPNWISMGFTLRGASDVAYVWVETELTETISEAQIDELQRHILTATPDASFRPDRGIIENNQDLFGDHPVLGTDPRVNILLHDIDEGAGQGCCVLGYVSSEDLNPESIISGRGNAAPVVYVDLPDGIQFGGVMLVATTIAHEYQHLIYNNYHRMSTVPAYTFVNEGLSEWAEVVNGYFMRTINYLRTPAEHDRPLLDWRRGQSPTVVGNDYQRAGLFTTYLGEQLGIYETGSIARAQKDSNGDSVFVTGAEAYDVVFGHQGLSPGEVVSGFHAANFLNDRSFGPPFGYEMAQRRGIRAVPTTLIDGQVQTSSSHPVVFVSAGAVRYQSWSSVKDIHINIGTANKAIGSHTVLRLFAEPYEGSSTFSTLDPNTTETFVEGEFRRVTLIIVNSDVGGTSPAEYSLSAEWSPGGLVTQSVAYDNGQLTENDELFYVFSNQSIRRLATKFTVPQNGRLESVGVAPLYINQFPNSEVPQGIPRAVRVAVWNDDGEGWPGELVYDVVVDDDPSGSRVNFNNRTFNFLEVNLSEASLSSDILTATIYVGLMNPDEWEGFHCNANNCLVSAFADYDGDENLSYIYLDLGDGPDWYRFDELTAGETPLSTKVAPIRATFVYSVSTGTYAEVPDRAVLEQNYPNPFNPSTSVTYHLPRTMEVRLSVYDMLGRRVAVVYDGMQPAGTHRAEIDAAAWASGVYVYALETEASTLTRRMVVLK